MDPGETWVPILQGWERDQYAGRGGESDSIVRSIYYLLFIIG